MILVTKACFSFSNMSGEVFESNLILIIIKSLHRTNIQKIILWVLFLDSFFKNKPNSFQIRYKNLQFHKKGSAK